MTAPLNTAPPGFVPSTGAAAAGAGTGAPITPTTPTTPPAGGIDPTALLSAVQSKLLSQSGMSSSTDSDLQTSLNQAMQGIQTAQSNSDQATTLDYNQQISDAQDKGAQDVIAGRAAQSGGVLNIGALRAVTDTIDKNVNDLEKQKQQAILSNDSASASKLADMQMQAIQFKQTAQQNAFSQLLQLGQYGIQAQQQATAQKAADDAHQKAVGDLIQSNPDAGILATDTLDQAYAKIGHAPDSPALQLQKAQIAQIKAQTYKDMQPTARTADEQKAYATQQVDQYLVPGQTMTSKNADGSSTKAYVMEQNGTYITPQGWSAAMALAKKNGMARQDFIDNYSYLLAPDAKSQPGKSIDPAYGLSPKEIEGVLPKQ